jgi:hypothetical protein
MFTTVEIAPSPTTHAPVHELTAHRIAAWLGYQPVSPVPAELICRLPSRTPRGRAKFYALGSLVLEYMDKHPQHRFPERESPMALATAASGGIATTLELVLTSMGWPQTIYWAELLGNADAETRDRMKSPGGRHAASSMLWKLGYEKYPNPNEQKGRWLYRGAQTSRYRRRETAG